MSYEIQAVYLINDVLVGGGIPYFLIHFGLSDNLKCTY